MINRNRICKIRNSKKAFVEVQFSWIFMLFIGAIILMFFLGLSNWYQSRQNQSIAVDVVNKLNLLFSSAKQQSDTASTIPIPDIALSFSCDPETCSNSGCGESRFYFGNSGIGKPTPLDSIFAPKRISTDMLILWSLPFSMPFPADSFFYISSPYIKYVFVIPQDNGLTYSIEDYISNINQLNFDIIKDISEFSYDNEKWIRIVDFSSSVSFNSLPDLDSVKIDILSVNGNENYGSVVFKKKSNNNIVESAYPYLTAEMLLGAVFSEDGSLYWCNVLKSINRLSLVSGLYVEKMNMLSSKYSGDKTCEPYYNDAKGYFQDIMSLSSKISKDCDNCNAIFQQMSSDGEEISSLNDEVIRYTSPKNDLGCARIY